LQIQHEACSIQNEKYGVILSFGTENLISRFIFSIPSWLWKHAPRQNDDGKSSDHSECFILKYEF